VCISTVLLYLSKGTMRVLSRKPFQVAGKPNQASEVKVVCGTRSHLFDRRFGVYMWTHATTPKQPQNCTGISHVNKMRSNESLRHRAEASTPHLQINPNQGRSALLINGDNLFKISYLWYRCDLRILSSRLERISFFPSGLRLAHLML